MSFVQWVAPRRSACLAVSFAIRMIAIGTGAADAREILARVERATGVRPGFLQELKAYGIELPNTYFDPSQPV